METTAFGQQFASARYRDSSGDTVLCVLPPIFEPRQAMIMLALPVVVIVMVAELRSLPVRLEVAAALVRAKQGGWRRQPDMGASRREISAIRYYPYRISFREADGRPLMEPEPHWTLRQMLKVAAEIEVPLYDHRGTLGLEELAEGRLVYDPVSDRGSDVKLRRYGESGITTVFTEVAGAVFLVLAVALVVHGSVSIGSGAGPLISLIVGAVNGISIQLPPTQDLLNLAFGHHPAAAPWHSSSFRSRSASSFSSDFAFPLSLRCRC